MVYVHEGDCPSTVAVRSSVNEGIGRGDNTFVEEDFACENQYTLYQMPVLWFVWAFTGFNSSIAVTFGWKILNVIKFGLFLHYVCENSNLI